MKLYTMFITHIFVLKYLAQYSRADQRAMPDGRSELCPLLRYLVPVGTSLEVIISAKLNTSVQFQPLSPNSSKPKGCRQASRTSTDPTTGNSTRKNSKHSSYSPVPLDNRRRNFIEAKDSRCDNLAARLKCQESQGNQLDEIDLILDTIDAKWLGYHLCLYQRRGDY
ncbi:hypothetical protein EYC84_001291 [Monilinia fructicola]|uniref:Uncharacterized protein n=1 Tax=Monilinia fructicola TaxID=38448 RepID=A0A5M9JPH2_MONFR|nr:hypothetical protein EYC84_001291 [Monilinia fructicola]